MAVRRHRFRVGASPVSSLLPQRLAVGACFLVTGATFGTFAARVPDLQERLALSHGELGTAFAGLMLAAFAGIPPAGIVTGRLGSRRLLAISLLVFGSGLALIPFAGGLAGATATMSAFGAANSFVDVAINTQATHVERLYRRPILSGLHAMFSLGALVAAGVAAVLAARDVDVAAHFPVVAALLTATGLTAIRAMTAEPRDAGAPARLALPTRASFLPGVVAFCMVFAEDVANTWSTVYTRSVAGSSAAVAALTFALYSTGMLAGRLVADRLVAARGASTTLQAGAAVATAGISLAIVVPGTVTAAAGFALLGAGLAPVLPVLYSTVGSRDPDRAGTAIAAVTTVGYLGSVAGPPLVGALGESVGLRAAFVAVPLVTAAIGLAAARIGNHERL
jgi:MFS family permease